MRREIRRWHALANAVFVLAVLAVAGFGVTRVLARQWRWQETFRARVDFAAIGGLEVGGRVRVQGMDAGTVETIVPPQAPGLPVTLILRMDARLRPLIRSDATAKIASQGVVGAKVVEIVPGRADAPALAEEGPIRSEAPIELADLLKDASASLKKLDDVATTAREGLGEVNAIAASIRRGDGSLGKFVKDDEAYRKIVAMTDRGDRTLNDLEENLAALKRTWPLSRYFNNRAFFDRERVLFQPGSERESRVLDESDLFEPGRSVLTEQGRKALDKVAVWSSKALRPESEIVIAAFTDELGGGDLAEILTQEQADSVRKYLVSKHAIDAKGWFGSRKIAAIGFGNETPHLAAGEAANQPARRVEIIVFTPQS